MEALQLPDDGENLLDWVLKVRDLLLRAAISPPTELRRLLPPSQVCAVLDACYNILKKEPSLVQVPVHDVENCTVTVIGDTHGQFHDVVRLIEVAGTPSAASKFVFNGDFVDRGSWGLETLTWLACWKIALPTSVFLLRGNHESSTCTMLYGFKGELIAKYVAPKDFKEVYKACKKLFSGLPLGALIASATLVLHGGLYRKGSVPPSSHGKKKKRTRQPVYDCYTLPMELGGLEDLMKAAKGGMDPDGTGSSILATDVMWSDPVMEPGLKFNEQRGIGLVFGPDVTQAFLEKNHLKLVIRSHEGPDARDKRTDMQHMLEGYTVDHEVPAGKLMTVFSAPDYPQFQEGERFHNKAAVAVLSAPDYATPQMKQFTAVLPRPETTAYYDYNSIPDSDEDIGLTGNGCQSDMSEGSHLGEGDMEDDQEDENVSTATPFANGAAAPCTTDPTAACTTTDPAAPCTTTDPAAPCTATDPAAPCTTDSAKPSTAAATCQDDKQDMNGCQPSTNGHHSHDADVCMEDAHPAQNGHECNGEPIAGGNGLHATDDAHQEAAAGTPSRLLPRPPLHPHGTMHPPQTPITAKTGCHPSALASPAKWSASRSLAATTPDANAGNDADDEGDSRPRRCPPSMTPVKTPAPQ